MEPDRQEETIGSTRGVVDLEETEFYLGQINVFFIIASVNLYSALHVIFVDVMSLSMICV